MSKLDDNAQPDEKSSRRLPPGTVLGDFRITRYLDSGSMGAVYVAEQISLAREVALKIFSRALAPEPESREQFLNEIRLTASLDHPNIVTAFSAGQEGDYIYLAMKFIDARDLADLLSEYPRIDEGDALEIAEAIADALCYAWDEQKLIHRDIKPSNIKLSSSTKPHLLDLGISITAEQECALTAAGYVIGTPDYMSPEQCMGAKTVDFRADIYSLGATLYHMVTGTPPFQEPSPQRLLQAHIHEELEIPSIRNPKVSDSTCDLIASMMRKDPDQRPATWKEMIKAIQVARAKHREGQAAAVATPSAPAVDVPTPPPEPVAPASTDTTPPNKKFVAIAIVVVALFLLLIILSTCSGSKEESPQAPTAQVPAAPVKTAAENLLSQPYDTQGHLDELRQQLAVQLNSADSADDKNTILEALTKLENEERAAERIVDRLRNQAISLLDSAGPEQAIGLINRYEGVNSTWVKARQASLVSEIKAAAVRTPSDRKKDASRSQKRIKSIAQAIVGGNFNGARKQYREAELQPAPKSAAELRDAKAFVSLDLLIAESFRDQIGQMITIELAQGPHPVRIVAIKDAGITIESADKSTTTKTPKTVSWKQLAPKEWTKRLSGRSNAHERLQVLLLSGSDTRQDAIKQLHATNRPFLREIARSASRKK